MKQPPAHYGDCNVKIVIKADEQQLTFIFITDNLNILIQNVDKYNFRMYDSPERTSGWQLISEKN